MRVLVLGASGPSGERIVERALAAGHRVTALARNPASVGVEHTALDVVQGDVLDSAALRPAVVEQEAVVWAVGGHDIVRRVARREPRQPNLCARGTANALRAMEDAGVSRFVCQSSWGVGDSFTRAALPIRLFVFGLIMSGELADKEAQEALVLDSAVEWTIIRPTRLTDDPGSGRYRAAPGLGLPLGAHISRADVADLVVRELGERRFLRQVIEVTSA